MGIFDWIKEQLAADTSDTAAAEATLVRPKAAGDDRAVEHRSKRRELRDDRLLPKEDTRENWWEPRPRVMERSQANRLFSASMRTRDMNARTLSSDARRLESLGLPVWRTEDDLADALGLELSRLHYFACHRLDDRVCHYVTFRIPKASGGSRLIMAPKRELRSIQRKLLRLVVDRLPVSDCAHGFRKGRSVKTNAEPHVGKVLVIGMDLADFFPSVTFARVRGFLLSLGYGFEVATSLALLMTEAQRQPVEIDGVVHHAPTGRRYCVQGAPTSPGVCNALVQKLDHRLAGLARSVGWTYSRYADDIAFSGDDDGAVGALLSVTEAIVEDEGFSLNDKKTRVMHKGRHQRIAGVTVNETLGLSRKERRKIRAMIHRLNKDRQAGDLDPEEVRRLEGKLAWVEMLNEAQADALRRDWHHEGAPA